MSLYDKASLIFSGAAGAGNKDVAYNIKPVEKLKVDELITNGGFDTDSDWTKGTGITISGGKAVFTDVTPYQRMKTVENVFVSGKTYKLSYEVTEISGGKIAVQQDDQLNINNILTDPGKYSHVFEAKTYVDGNGDEHVNTKLVFKVTAGTVNCKIDNVSLKEVEQKANDFSFVRASDLTATYEGADGLIKKTRENVLQHSNDFSIVASDGGWDKGNATVTSGQSGYDGTTNAWKLSSTVSTSYNNIEQKSSNVSGITAYGDKIATFSVYLKKGNTDWARINLNGTGNIYFDLSGDGAVGTASSSNLFGKIEKIGDSEWFRCSVTRLKGGTFSGVLVYVAASDGNLLASDHSESKHIFVQNAQLEYGLVATPYIDRTDAYSKSTSGIQEDEPRYDYSLDNDAPPVLMLEPERQNLLEHSEYMDSYRFSTSRCTVSANHGTSPDGSENSTLVSNTAESGNKRLYGSNSFSVDSGTTYTASIFAKKGTLKNISMEILASNETSIGFDEPLFDLEAGSVSYLHGSSSTSTATIEDFGNGWFRCSVSDAPTSSTASARLYIYIVQDDADDATDKNYLGSTSENVELFGAQVEKGSYATSYIPTYGSAATREGEAHNSLSSFSCKLDKPLTKKYTILVDVRVDNLERPTTNFDDIFIARGDGLNPYSLRIEGYYNPTPDPDTYSLRVFAYGVEDTGSGTTTPHVNGIQLGARNKIAIVYDESVGIKIFVNGNSTPMGQTLEAKTMKVVKYFEGGAQPRSKTFLYGVQAYDEALSDAECVSLTTIS